MTFLIFSYYTGKILGIYWENGQNQAFRGLIAKIGYLRTFLASRTHLWPIFMNYAMGIVP